MLKVAVIGLGTMGSTHLEAWSTIAGVKVVAVCGRNLEKAEQIAEKYGAAAFVSFADMCSKLDFDVADICLPTHLHSAYVSEAALAGKHIICEKPLALHPDEAGRLIDLCQQHKVKLMIGHNLRFCPEYKQAHDWVVAGKLGRIGVARLSRRTHYPLGANNWYADRSKSGGMIMDLLIHDLDWLLWTFGQAERVTTLRVERSAATNPLEYALISIRFANGTMAHVEGSWAHTNFTSSFEISGTKGMITENGAESVPLVVHRRSGPAGSQAVAVPEMTLVRNPYELALEHFARCIEHDVDPIITAHDALAAVELARAAITSAETGQPVLLEKRGGVR